MKKIVFIGSLQWGQLTTGGGVQTKNQHLLNYILDNGFDCDFLDIFGKKMVVSLFLSIFYILRNKKDTPIFLSVSHRGAFYIGLSCKLLHLNRRIFFWVPGGNIVSILSSSSSKMSSLFKTFEKVIVQGDYIKRDLEKMGFNNCVVVPNFKHIFFKPSAHKEYQLPFKLVYISRIIGEKGIEEIVSAIRNINNNNIIVDFYGAIYKPYTKQYFDDLNSLNIFYKGFLDLNSKDGYDILSKYDLMLFPTYFEGEGFPGVLVDSFIAGVPVITTTFHANPEIISDGINGLLIPPHDAVALKKSINTSLNDIGLLQKMRKNAILSAQKYDCKEVLTLAFRLLNI